MRNTRTSLWRCTILWYFLAVGMFFILCEGNAHAADSDKHITCSLSSEKRSFTTGDQITVQVNLANGSASVITVLVPEDPVLLLTWGVVKLAIRNAKGALYTFVPLPAPFIPTVYEHYQKLLPGQQVTRSLNLCALRDKENSHSPCTIKERFTIEAIYSTDKDTYWDENKKQFEQMSGVWKGAVSCGQVTIDTVD